MRDVREVLRLHREGCVPMREVVQGLAGNGDVETVAYREIR